MSQYPEQLEQNIKKVYDSRFEQVDASVRFVLINDPLLYEHLTRPERVKEAILHMVRHWPSVDGYHYHVLRAAHRQYSMLTGFMTAEEPPYTHEELYDR